MGHACMQGPLRLAPDLEASLAQCGAALDFASRAALASATPAAQLECIRAIQGALPEQCSNACLHSGRDPWGHQHPDQM